jgi:RHS repeat-associated protein
VQAKRSRRIINHRITEAVVDVVATTTTTHVTKKQQAYHTQNTKIKRCWVNRLPNTHDAAYRLTNQTLGNGLTRTINYGRQDNLRTTDTTFDGAQALDDLALSYTYAPDKQITAENIVGDVVQNTSLTSSYDAGNRITNWTRDTNNNQSWNYDDAGNWSSTTVASTSTSISPSNTRNHSVSDEITNIAGNAAVHDVKGNLTEYEINSKVYEVNYDLDNRIIKVDVNNDDVEYRYDALGRRVIRKEGSTQTALLWWGDSECAEYVHGAGQATIQNDIMSHPSRLNAVIARAVDGSKFDLEWYHKNYLEHVYAVSNDSGNLTEHYRYTAFGEVTIYNSAGSIQTSTQINNQITWNTRRLDTVSNYYLYKYRHYDPALGRWPSRDPIEERGGVNLYTFVGNEPVGRWDKLGLNTIVIIIGGPSLGRVQGHDESALNFINNGMRRALAEAEKCWDESAKKCCCEVVIFYNDTAYTRRTEYDVANRGRRESAGNYGSNIHAAIRAAGDKGKCMRPARKQDADDMMGHLNNIDDISNLIYFGHSNANSLFFEYGSEEGVNDGSNGNAEYPTQGETIGVGDFETNNFLPNATCEHYGCHGGVPGGFAEQMASQHNVTSTGATSTTHYGESGAVGGPMTPSVQNGGSYVTYPSTPLTPPGP